MPRFSTDTLDACITVEALGVPGADVPAAGPEAVSCNTSPPFSTGGQKKNRIYVWSYFIYISRALVRNPGFFCPTSKTPSPVSTPPRIRIRMPWKLRVIRYLRGTCSSVPPEITRGLTRLLRRSVFADRSSSLSPRSGAQDLGVCIVYAYTYTYTTQGRQAGHKNLKPVFFFFFFAGNGF